SNRSCIERGRTTSQPTKHSTAESSSSPKRRRRRVIALQGYPRGRSLGSPFPARPFPLPIRPVDPVTASGDNAGEEGRPMTEAEWLAGEEPGELLVLVREKASERQLRLFALACCRRIDRFFTDPRCRAALNFAEQYTDVGFRHDQV